MSRAESTDPRVTQELIELEAALADAPDANASLLELVADVRSTRPVADPAFLARLEADADAGFGAATKSGGRRWTMPSLRVALPMAGTALAAAVVAVVIATGDTTVPPSNQLAEGPPRSVGVAPTAGGTGAGARESLEGAKKANETADSSDALAANGATPLVQSQRQVERNASLTLAAPGGKVQETADQIVQTTGRLGGFVASSNVSLQEGTGTANLQLRVPSGRLDEAMAALAKLGDVRAMDQAEQDITGTFSAANAALEDAKAERQGLLSGLRNAKDAAQIARFKVRLRENAARIASADAALTSVRNRAARATITVQVVTSGKDGDGEVTEQGFGISVAVDAALRVLSASIGVLVLIIAAAIPLIAVTFVGLAAMRTTRRRRREQALDGSAETRDR